MINFHCTIDSCNLAFFHCSCSTSSIKQYSINSASFNSYTIPEYTAVAAAAGAAEKTAVECLYDVVTEDRAAHKPGTDSKVETSEYATIDTDDDTKPKSASRPTAATSRPLVLNYTTEDYAMVNKPTYKKKVEDQPSAEEETVSMTGTNSKVETSEYATIDTDDDTKPESASRPTAATSRPLVLNYTTEDYAMVNKPTHKKKVEDQPSAEEEIVSKTGTNSKVETSEYASIDDAEQDTSSLLPSAVTSQPPTVLSYTTEDYAIINKTTNGEVSPSAEANNESLTSGFSDTLDDTEKQVMEECNDNDDQQDTVVSMESEKCALED